MTDWKLTDEEIRVVDDQLVEDDYYMAIPVGDDAEFVYAAKVVALAAQQKLAKWGNELCEEHFPTMPQFRRQCVICWQALCEELGVK